MMLFPPPRKVSEQNSKLDYSRRRWLILPHGAGFELKEAACRTAAELSGRFFAPVEVTAGISGSGECLLVMARDPELPDDSAV